MGCGLRYHFHSNPPKTLKIKSRLNPRPPWRYNGNAEKRKMRIHSNSKKTTLS